MRWRAALVPLAAVTAATLLFSTAAWGQAPGEAPEPTTTETPVPTMTETPVPEETADIEEPEPAPAPKKLRSNRTEVQGGPSPLAVPTKVTLYIASKDGPVGRSVRAWGKASPDGENRWIKIVNAETGYKIRTVKTDDEGRFSATLRVRRNVAIKARWKNVKSRWRHLFATPELDLHMDAALLFSRTKVAGRISPAAGGKWVKLQLRKAETGKIVARRAVRAGDSGHFHTRFSIRYPGTYRAHARFENENWRKVSTRTAGRGTPLPSLGLGSGGIYVNLLERRLARLRYRLAGENFYYGQDTSDAVMAFNKVAGRARVGYVTTSTWQALALAHRPKPRYRHPGFHIEVNQSKQVLFVVRRGKVKAVLHVSTGAPSTPTYDGTYEFWGKVAGYSPKRLYYPSYFHGARAIHGWQSVPPYNASHGCVRAPMWAARWIYAQTEIGDTIRIYH